MFIRLILTVLLLATSVQAQTTFKVWTANVQHGEGTDSTTPNYTRQANVFTASGAEVVCMQERTTGDSSWNSPMSGWTEEIYKENDPTQGDGPSIWVKNGITVNDRYQHDLSTNALGWGGVNVDKAAVGVKLTISGKTFYIFNTHLAWSAGADCDGCQTSAIREAQIAELLSWINSIVGSDKNWILVGDMNLSPTMPKISGGFQIDLFTNANLSSVRALGTANSYFTVNWGDRNSDSIIDNSVSSPITHDTREIDYIFTNNFANLFRPTAIDMSDLRATCSTTFVNDGGSFPACPDVRVDQRTDRESDFGVRPSDHNWLMATFTLAPIASFSIPSTAFVGETIVADGCSSIGVNGQNGCSVETFSNASSPVSWNFGDNSGTYSTPKLLKPTHTFQSAGTFNVQLEVKDSAGNSHSISHSITVTDIPTATGDNLRTAVEQGSGAANATHVQSLINTSCANNTVEQEIRVPNTMQITGQLNWCNTYAGDKYITLRPVDLTNLPDQKTRINPAVHAAFMPKISSPGVDLLPLNVPLNSKYLRIIGFEFNKQAGHLYQFIEIGSGPTAYSQLPHHIIIDRCYFKGNVGDSTARAVFVNADTFTFMNSYTLYMKDDGADAQSIAGFAGNGIGIVNNFLDGLGENLLFGGADSGIKFQTTVTSGATPTSAVFASVASLRVGDGMSLVPVGGSRGPWSATIVRSINGNTVTFDQITNQAGTPTAPDTTANAVKYGASPQNIFISRNYLFKSLTFRVSDPLYAGIYAVVKNSFELKHAMNVIFDGNIIENNWGGQGQSGPTILLTPRNQTCYLLTFPHDPVTCPAQTNPWAMVRDTQITNNRIINVNTVVNILGTDNLNPPGTGDDSGPSAFVQYVLIENNLIEKVDPASLSNPVDTGGGELIFMFPGARHITISHNTQHNLSGNRTGSSTNAPIGNISNDVKFMNNIVMHRTYGFIGDGNLANDFVNIFWPDGFITYNVISDDIGGKVANGGTWTTPRTMPNYFPPTEDTDTFIDLAGRNFKLKNTSPYKAGNATPAADGTDIGVNFDVVTTSTANTITGNWGAGASIKKCNWHTNPRCNQ